MMGANWQDGNVDTRSWWWPGRDPRTTRPVNLQPDRRKAPRVFDPNLNRVYEAYRTIAARAKHKPNPGLDARAAKSAARILVNKENTK